MEITSEELPARDIHEAAKAVRLIRHRFDGTITPELEDELADALDHKSANSGAFRSKLADLRKYGLIDGWGEKTLTERGRALEEQPQRVAREIIDDNPLYRAAHDRFETDLPDADDWAAFLADTDIDIPEKTADQARRTYRSLIEHLPDDTNPEPFPESVFTKYYADLEKDSKRELCLESLAELAARPLPTIRCYDKIFELLEEHIHPEDEARVLRILQVMCATSTEEIRDARHEETVTLAIEYLDTEYDAETRLAAIKILEAMDPAHADDDHGERLWAITQAFARDGIQNDDEDLLKHANRLFRRLKDDWADEALLETMWEETYEDYDATTPYGQHVKYWHKDCQKARGLTQQSSL